MYFLYKYGHLKQFGRISSMCQKDGPQAAVDFFMKTSI